MLKPGRGDILISVGLRTIIFTVGVDDKLTFTVSTGIIEAVRVSLYLTGQLRDPALKHVS